MSHRSVRIMLALVAGLALAAPAAVVFARARHPHVVRAQKLLDKAAGQLEKAAHDYGGHRAKALELVKQAQDELKAALDYAAQHPEEAKNKK